MVRECSEGGKGPPHGHPLGSTSPGVNGLGDGVGAVGDDVVIDVAEEDTIAAEFPADDAIAEGLAALADAERVEAEQRAAVEAPAKAAKARMIVDAEATAERVRIEAEGQASAIFAKLDAEARGQYEILAKKAEGLKLLVDSCGGSREAFQLLMLEHLDHLTDASAKAISNIKFDKIVVWDGGGQAGGRGAVGEFLNGMSKTLPPMMQVMKDIGGVELPESLVKFAENESK